MKGMVDMTIEEARKELGEYLHRKKQIEIKRKKIDDLRRLVQSCKSPKFEMQITGGNVNLSYQIAKIADFEKELEQDMIKAEMICQDIESKIYNVGIQNVLLADILEMRYVLARKCEEVAVYFNYDYKWVIKLIKKGIKLYSEIN